MSARGGSQQTSSDTGRRARMQNVHPTPPQTPQPAAERPNAARMPKARAQRIASGLKKGVLAGSVVAFGGFAALVAGNVVGATAQSSTSGSQSSDSSSSSSQSGQNSDQNNGNFFGGG